MRVFKSTWFTRFAAKEDITDGELIEMVNRLEAGQAEADLGGGVYKVRLARSGEGKSGGYRIIVFFRSEDITFYYYAYPKAARLNISEKQLRSFKKVAKKYLAMTDREQTEAVNAREFVEIEEVVL
jgi:hypothetical protein